ncbi:MAG: hypothetical protein IJP82_09360 [Bacteroidaceae bacterium]|nr:hypothetical protein [Bacteroidaceae bacterium]
MMEKNPQQNSKMIALLTFVALTVVYIAVALISSFGNASNGATANDSIPVSVDTISNSLNPTLP